MGSCREFFACVAAGVEQQHDAPILFGVGKPRNFKGLPDHPAILTETGSRATVWRPRLEGKNIADHPSQFGGLEHLFFPPSRCRRRLAAPVDAARIADRAESGQSDLGETLQNRTPPKNVAKGLCTAA